MEMQLFSSAEFGALRAIERGGEPWFVAKDVCGALGLGRQQDSTRHLDEDERGACLVDTPSGQQEMTVVNEPGLYSLILRSRKPEAKAFKRWITHEVIPSIRRHCGYMAGQESMTPEQMALASMRWLESKVAEQAAQIEEMRPKALFADAVAASDGTCLVGELAKMLRQNGVPIGQNRLFDRMREDGFLGKSGANRNVPTQRAMEIGLFRIKETAVTHSDGRVTINRTPKVTGKGQRYFMDRYGSEVADADAR